MGMTNTHNQTLTPEVVKSYPSPLILTLVSCFTHQAFKSLSHIWEPFLLNEIKIFTLFYRWWFHRALQLPPTAIASNETSDVVPRIPILLVRYEDLLEDKEVLTFPSPPPLSQTHLPLSLLQSCLRTIRDFLQAGKPPLGINLCRLSTQQQPKSSAGYAPRVV